MVLLSIPSHTSNPQLTSSAPAITRDCSLSLALPVMTTRSRQSWVPSRLRMLGVHHRKSVRRLGNVTQDERQLEDAKNGIIIEEHDVSVLWKLLGLGFHWRQQYTYGSVIPTLTIFPVIEIIPQKYFQIKKAFPNLSGAARFLSTSFEFGHDSPLHSRYTRSLLHVSKHGVTLS